MDHTIQTPASKDKTPFNFSSLMSTTNIHIAVEVIIGCIFFVYFNRKINNQKSMYDARIEALETQLKEVEEILKMLLQQKDIPPPPRSKREPRPQAQPQAQPQAPANLAMNFFQEFMQSSVIEPPERATNLPSIVEINEPVDVKPDEVPISRDQLDRELSEELGELVPK